MAGKHSIEREPDELLDREDDDELEEDGEEAERQARAQAADEERRRSQKVDDYGEDNVHKPQDDDDDDGKGDDDESDAAVEARARTLGWVPESEWRGRRERWTPAREFLERAYVNRGINKEQTDKLINEVSELRRQNAEFAERMKESGEVLGSIMSRFERADAAAYARARRDIEEDRRRAVEDGDTEAFDAAEEKLKNLKAPEARKPKEEEDPGDGGEGGDPKPRDPAAQDFIDRNEWYRTDPTLNAVAQAIHVERGRTHKGETLAQNLAFVEEEVKRRFPEKFENQRRNAPDDPRPRERREEEGGSRRRKRTVADLPPEARAALAKLKSQIKGYTDQQYLDHYYEE